MRINIAIMARPGIACKIRDELLVDITNKSDGN